MCVGMTTKIIYILNADGEPLMPTHRLGMVRHWLNGHEAHWYGNRRDTIQFDRSVGNKTQKCIEGVDLGNHLGISVVCPATNKELYRSVSHRDYQGEVKRNIKRRKQRRTYNSKRSERGCKKTKGRRSIRRQHYSFQPHDKILYQGQITECRGTLNHGNSIQFHLSNGKIKSIKPANLKLLHHANGWQTNIIK